MKHARDHRAEKRGGRALRITLPEAGLPGDHVEIEDLLALNRALERLEALDPRQARIVELKFFGGLGSREIEEVLNVSRSTVDREWRTACVWLKHELM